MEGKGLAVDHQRRDRVDAGRLGFRDPSRRVAEMDDLDVILRGIERMGEALFGADADRAPGMVKRRFLGHDEMFLPYPRVENRAPRSLPRPGRSQIGRASWRERVWQDV